MKNNFICNIKKPAVRILVFALTLALAFLIVSAPVFAAPVDTTKTNAGISSIGETLQTIAEPIFFVLIVVSGIAMMGGNSGRAWAKPTFLFGVIGMGIVSFAPTIVTMVKAMFS